MKVVRRPHDRHPSVLEDRWFPHPLEKVIPPCGEAAQELGVGSATQSQAVAILSEPEVLTVQQDRCATGRGVTRCESVEELLNLCQDRLRWL